MSCDSVSRRACKALQILESDTGRSSYGTAETGQVRKVVGSAANGRIEPALTGAAL